MAAKLAILAALVACAFAAAEARQNTKAVYEWAALSNVDRRFFNADNTYFFVERQSQGLTFNTEVLRSLKGVTVDVQVLGQGRSGRWKIIQSEQDAELNTDNTPEAVSAYGVLLGLQDSQPAIISQNSQSGEASSTQFGENSADQSGQASIAQSSEADIELTRSGEVASVTKGQSSANQGLISLQNFRPKSSQISSLVGTGRQIVQFSFKWGNRKILTAEFIVRLWSS